MFRQYFAHLAQLHIPYPSAAVTQAYAGLTGYATQPALPVNRAFVGPPGREP